jgi:DNA polymerase III subunit delta'
MIQKSFIPVAQLWLGDSSAVISQVTWLLQQNLNECKGCKQCSACGSVAARQHHALLWLSPEFRYTVEILEPLLQTVSYTLAPGQKFFCVIEHADRMPQQCSDRLLKILEEPPAGYHFLLLAQRSHDISPTIRSRCHSKVLQQQQIAQYITDWKKFFTTDISGSPLEFLTCLADSKISWENSEHLDAIMLWWQEEYYQASAENNQKRMEQGSKILMLLAGYYEKLPMPGSGKIFWKNLWIELHQIICQKSS